MESPEPMSTTANKPPAGRSVTIHAEGYTEAEVRALAECLGRRLAERHVMDIFSSHMRSPLGRIFKNLNRASGLALKNASRGR